MTSKKSRNMVSTTSAMTATLLVTFFISTSAFQSRGIAVPMAASLVARKSASEPSSGDVPMALESSSPAPLDAAKKQTNPKKEDKWRLSIKPPENVFVLGGDVLTLMTYAFLDHGATYHTASQITQDPAALTSNVLEQFNLPLDPVSPVWLDAARTSTEQLTKIQASLVVGHLQYSPAFASAGLSAVLLTASWIGVGMLVGAFDEERTLDCSLHEMLRNVGLAWLGTSALMVGLAVFSDISVCGCPHHPSVGLTKCDADFLADSLTVLLSWRTAVGLLFGNNTGRGRRKK